MRSTVEQTKLLSLRKNRLQVEELEPVDVVYMKYGIFALINDSEVLDDSLNISISYAKLSSTLSIEAALPHL